MKNKLIFITSNNPYSKVDGGKILTQMVLNELKKYYVIDLIFLDKKNDNIPNFINKIKNFNKNNWYYSFFMSFFNRKPAIYNRYRRKKMIKYLKKNIQKYNIIFFDHLVSVNLYDEIKKKYLKDKMILFLDHNLEYKVWEDYINIYNYPIIKNIFKFQKKLVLKFEKKAYSISDKVYLVSDKEKRILIKNNFIEKTKVNVLPMYYYKKEKTNKFINRKYDHIFEHKLSLLFTATYKWYPNQNGINWFLKNCWKILKKKYPQLQLILAGNDPTNFALNLSNKYKNVFSTGYVDNIDYFFKKSDIFILPMKIGSGIKIKFFEALFYGMPIVTTKKGIEGIENIEDYDICLTSNSSEEFISNIEKLINNNNLRKKISYNALNFNKKQKNKFVNIFKLLEEPNDEFKTNH